MYVAVGDGGKIATSSNGSTWTQRTSNTGSILKCVCYGNGLYIAAGASGTIVTSTDGITWAARTSNFGLTDIYGIAYGSGIFVACGDNVKIGTSTNGMIWTTNIVVTLGSVTCNGGYRAISFGNNSGPSNANQTGFFMGGYTIGANGQFYGLNAWSVDGINWAGSYHGGFYINVTSTLCALNYSFIGGDCTTGQFGTLQIGVTYTTDKPANATAITYTPPVRSMCFDNSNQILTIGDAGSAYIIGASTINSYPSGVDETTINNSNGVNLRGCCYGSDQYIVVGTNGVLLTRNHYIYP